MKIRVQESQTSMRMVSELGGSPTPISFGELYTALQQGVRRRGREQPALVLHLAPLRDRQVLLAQRAHRRPGRPSSSARRCGRSSPRSSGSGCRRPPPSRRSGRRCCGRRRRRRPCRRCRRPASKSSAPRKGPFREKVADMLDGYRDQPELYGLIERIQEEGG